MPTSPLVRPLRAADFDAWQPLWNGYNAFYGRHGATALAPEITATTWQRFLDSNEPVFGLAAEAANGQLLGLAHYVLHRSTTHVGLTCYLQDLFTAEDARGRGVGRSLIGAVYDAAKAAGVTRVYWQTQHSNHAGRALYDKLAAHAGFIVYARDL